MKEKTDRSKPKKKENLKKLTISEIKDQGMVYEVVSLHLIDQPEEFGFQFVIEGM